MSQQINLFNPIFLTQKKYFSAVTMVQALVLILLGVGLIAVYASVQVTRLRPEAAAVTAQLDAAKAQLALVTAEQGARQKDVALDNRVRRLEAEVFALQRVSHLLGNEEGGGVKGYAEYMRAFSRQVVNGLWLTSFSIAGNGGQISLAGGAIRPELVPAFLGRLGNEPTMRHRSFDMLEMAAGDDQGRDTSTVTFQLSSAAAARSSDTAEGR